MPSKSVWMFAAAMGVPSLGLVIYIHQRSALPSVGDARVFPARNDGTAIRPKLNEPSANSIVVSSAPTAGASSLQYVRHQAAENASVENRKDRPAAESPPPASTAVATSSSPIQAHAQGASKAAPPPTQEPAPRKKLTSKFKNFNATNGFGKFKFNTRHTPLIKADMTNSILNPEPKKKSDPVQIPPNTAASSAKAVDRATSAGTKEEAPGKTYAPPAKAPRPTTEEPGASSDISFATSAPAGGVVDLGAVQSAPQATLRRNPKEGVPLDPSGSPPN